MWPLWFCFNQREIIAYNLFETVKKKKTVKILSILFLTFEGEKTSAATTARTGAPSRASEEHRTEIAGCRWENPFIWKKECRKYQNHCRPHIEGNVMLLY